MTQKMTKAEMDQLEQDVNNPGRYIGMLEHTARQVTAAKTPEEKHALIRGALMATPLFLKATGNQDMAVAFAKMIEFYLFGDSDKVEISVPRLLSEQRVQ